MKENEEITNLERFELLIEDCKGHRELYGESSVGEYDIEIMQHILSDYKRVLKENEELKKFITEGITIEPNSPYKNYQLDFLRKNFIPVKKVKDKIEEEKIPLTIVGGRKNKKTLEYGIKLGRRHVLQELLEGRKEK